MQLQDSIEEQLWRELVVAATPVFVKSEGIFNAANLATQYADYVTKQFRDRLSHIELKENIS